MRISKTIIAATAALAVGGSTAAALAQSGQSAPGPAQPQPQPVGATAEQQAAFGVLRRAPGADDGDNRLVRRLAGAAQIGMDADAARVVGRVDGLRVWLVPAQGALCLALEDDRDDSIGITCEPTADVVSRGTTIGDGHRVFGLVPDGVPTVVVHAEGGRSATVGVGSDGLYTLGEGHVAVTVGSTAFDVAG
jgi:hypothetical protein